MLFGSNNGAAKPKAINAHQAVVEYAPDGTVVAANVGFAAMLDICGKRVNLIDLKFKYIKLFLIRKIYE